MKQIIEFHITYLIGDVILTFKCRVGEVTTAHQYWNFVTFNDSVGIIIILLFSIIAAFLRYITSAQCSTYNDIDIIKSYYY